MSVTTTGPPTVEATKRLLTTNPGMHRLNEKVMGQVFTGLENEVVCTFCLLQVLSLAYQLGNRTVRTEVEVGLESTQPDDLAVALLWAASAENQTLTGTLLGYYQRDEPPTCDQPAPAVRSPARSPARSPPQDPERCRRIQEFVADSGRPVDFKQPSTTDQINAEVSRATGGRIEELFTPLPSDTRLVFVSALVFADHWRSRMVTARGLFHGAKRDVQTELLLLREDLPILDGTADGVIGVSLPYEQPGVRMFVFTTVDGSDVRRRLSQQHYERLAAVKQLTYTRVTMPSFDIASKKRSYIDLVSEMGMGTMFAGGMGADDQLKVAKLEHKAVIKTDRDGTQAAGAAGVAVVPLSAKPQPFQARFDRPFVCSLVHTELGVPIFTAYVADPLLK
ncbi:Serine proteinase inhibitor 2 [Amphibalanus amphitrite]|uniref:Serine proteinase inhibitor 2 n=1 Tax=Amphibalanus amphitrite TaxID=1232801 RepID=A0A6A4W749_AMPAM|nr:Serine proteinase inhibitor 2 [Amphibalanus amphitrite]